MRKKIRIDFCDRAYDYIAENGEVSAAQLIDGLRTRGTTGRTDANLPTLNSLVQWLRMDKRFTSVYRNVPNYSETGTYQLLHYTLTEASE